MGPMARNLGNSTHLFQREPQVAMSQENLSKGRVNSRITKEQELTYKHTKKEK
jgi:hypothetical protein